MARIHDSVQNGFLSDYPGYKDILRCFLHGFDVTWASKERRFGSEYLVAFLKPEEHLTEMFGFDNEILLIHANYRQLEQRVLQTADALLAELPARNRVDPLLLVLVSSADNLAEFADRYRTDNVQTRILIPFGEAECLNAEGDSYFVRNQFRKHLFARDLFDVSQPIRSDIYFFGRTTFVNEIVDGIRAGKNYGLFGLRKMGKTSILFKLERALAAVKSAMVYVDLQDAALYRLHWWQLLDIISARLSDAAKAAHRASTEPGDGPIAAAVRFRKVVESLPKSDHFVVALDEIEHIAPGLCIEKHWSLEFLEFWKTIRSVQNVNPHLTFIVAGVNASVIETPTYGGHDNPLYAMAQVRYVPSFEIAEVRNMARRLGRHMGMQFTENVYQYLHERYGGHPSLTRMICSKIHHSTLERTRPVALSRAEFVAMEKEHERSLFPFGKHVLGFLKQWYPDEYAMLEILACGKVEEYEQFADGAPEYAEHLVQYQLVSHKPAMIRIPLLKACLLPGATIPRRNEPTVGERTGVTQPQDTSPHEHWASISSLRNRLEPKLRIFIRRVFKAQFGPERWIDPIMKVIPSKDRDRLQGVDRNEILERRLFLLNLLTVVDQNWDHFKTLEAAVPERRVTKDQFRLLLEYVNAHREDAHAKPVTDTEVVTLKLVVEAIEAAIDHLVND